MMSNFFAVRFVDQPNSLIPLSIGAVTAVNAIAAIHGIWIGVFAIDPSWVLLVAVIAGCYAIAIRGRSRFRYDPIDYVIALLLAILFDAIIGFRTAVEPMFVDSLLHSTSLLTTTAAHVYTGLDDFPDPIQVHRALMQALGAIWMVQFTAIAIPARIMKGVGVTEGVEVHKNEAYRRSLDRLWYGVVLTMAALIITATILFIFLGLGALDAFILASALTSLGGHLNADASISVYPASIQLVACAVMLVAATNWLLHLKAALRQRPTLYLSSRELLLFMGLVAFGFIISLLYYSTIRTSGGFTDISAREILDVLLFVVSTITTTGVASADYLLFGSGFAGLAMLLALLGGCSGSPSGGIKTARVLLQAKSIWLIFSGRRFTRHGSVTLSLGTLQYLQVFITFFFLLIFVSVTVLSFLGLETTTAFSLTVANLTNLGVGVGDIIGPAGYYGALSDSVKYWTIFLMIMGRLDLGLVFVFASRRYWTSPDSIAADS